jgi:O-glycosyl hydrolase
LSELPTDEFLHRLRHNGLSRHDVIAKVESVLADRAARDATITQLEAEIGVLQAAAEQTVEGYGASYWHSRWAIAVEERDAAETRLAAAEPVEGVVVEDAP